MKSQPAEPPKGPAWAVAEAQFSACKSIHDFIGATVRPILDRNTDSTSRGTINGLATRVHGWLRSLGKLDYPGDYQAVLAGSRAMFELALDLVLLLHQERGALDKLDAWQESSKLKLAERLSRYPGTNRQDAVDFVARQGAAIKVLRDQHWNGGHPDRWTGRNLEQDAKAADAFERHGFGFESYYNEQYMQVCWHVHGSGVRGLRQIPTEMFPYLSARGFYDAAHFALVACRAALKLFGQFDAIAEQRFSGLKTQIAEDKGEVWLRYNPPPSGV